MSERLPLLDRLRSVIEVIPRAAAAKDSFGKLVWRAGVADSRELRRVLSLPRRVVVADKVPDLTPLYRIDISGCQGCELCFSGAAALWKKQSFALLSKRKHEAACLVRLGVGEGKTLLSLLLPDALQSRIAVLLVPPSVRDQLIKNDIPRLLKHFQIAARPHSYCDVLTTSNKPKPPVSSRAHSTGHNHRRRSAVLEEQKRRAHSSFSRLHEEASKHQLRFFVGHHHEQKLEGLCASH